MAFNLMRCSQPLWRPAHLEVGSKRLSTNACLAALVFILMLSLALAGRADTPWAYPLVLIASAGIGASNRRGDRGHLRHIDRRVPRRMSRRGGLARGCSSAASAHHEHVHGRYAHQPQRCESVRLSVGDRGVCRVGMDRRAPPRSSRPATGACSRHRRTVHRRISSSRRLGQAVGQVRSYAVLRRFGNEGAHFMRYPFKAIVIVAVAARPARRPSMHKRQKTEALTRYYRKSPSPPSSADRICRTRPFRSTRAQRGNARGAQPDDPGRGGGSDTQPCF